MGFFNKFTQSVSNGVNTIGDKAKGFSEQAGLEGTIRQANEEKNRLYAKIGFQYYEDQKKGTASDYQELIRGIDEANAKIEEAQKRIQEIKSMITCPNCGRKLPPDMKFCSYCGASLETAPEPSPVKMAASGSCPNCGKPLAEGALFCTYCGTRIEQAPAPEPEEVKSPLVCANCGKPLEPGSMFCTYCGAPVPGAGEADEAGAAAPADTGIAAEDPLPSTEKSEAEAPAPEVPAPETSDEGQAPESGSQDTAPEEDGNAE